MSYTTPPTFADDDVLAAADLNILSDDIEDLDSRVTSLSGSGVRLTKSGTLAVTTAVYSTISWSAATFDEGNWWTSGTDITVPTGSVPSGYTAIAVLATGKARFAANGTGARQLRFLVNGSAAAATSTSGLSGETTDMDLTDRLMVVDGDVITMQISQTSGGSLNADQIVFSVARDFPIT